MNLLQLIANCARKTPNRGNVHIFLGDPAADLCDTTTVEPGNTYSPGIWTCGVSFWLAVKNQIYTPDLLSEDAIIWGFDNDGETPPIIKASYEADKVSVTHRLWHLGTEGAEGVDFNHVVIESQTTEQVTFCIVVKSNGPAGGVVKQLTWDDARATLLVNDTIKLCVESPVLACYFDDQTQDDISPLAIVHLTTEITPENPVEIRFTTEHGFDNQGFVRFIPKAKPYAGMAVDAAYAAAIERWSTELPGRIFAPDPRIAQVWEACAYHILTAMEGNLPRISAINYPIFWIRDGIIILRALDIIGRHDLARIGNDYLALLDFGGGFGAESDAPGEGIWALVNHARITHDLSWLASMWPHIQRRIEWLQRMRTATTPLRALAENRRANMYNTPMSTILCLPAQNDYIHGRMDGHSPDFYINSWAIAGFRQAIWAAEQLGQDAADWRAEADVLESAMVKHLLPRYGNARDSVVAPYPTGALSETPYRNALREQFINWYRTHRLDPEGKRKREQLWTYFEAAQIHNALILDFKDMAWICLDGMLDDACKPWMIAAWIEGPPSGGEELPYRNDEGACGWLRHETAVGGNMPHNWTGAEMLNLLRTVFVREEKQGLVLGLGAPEKWLVPGASFGVRDLPTELGSVSYTVSVTEDGEVQLAYEGPENYRCAWNDIS
jgi:hypothetical protein